MAEFQNPRSETTTLLIHRTIRRKLEWILLLGLMLAACAEFVARGPIRFSRARDFNDFIPLYIQAQAWTRGLDPYSPANLVALWPKGARQFSFLTKDLSNGSLVLNRGIPAAYPPTMLALLAPISLLPWPVAHALWLIINIVVFGVTVASLLYVAGHRLHGEQGYLFVALTLALAPFHTGLAAGSIAIVAVGLSAWAVLAAARQRDLMAGILIGAAAGLKPQIGLPFLAYYSLRRRWHIFSSAAILVGVLAAVAVVRLAVSHTAWIASYVEDNRIVFAKGSLADFTESNPIRHGLVNLQLPLYNLLHDRAWANILAMVVAGVLGLMWLFLLLRRAFAGTELLALSTLLVLSLLPVYHRLYDASLLVFPLAWSLSGSTHLGRRLERIAFFLILLFLVPAGSLLEQAPPVGWLLRPQHEWWWTDVLMPCQAWGILLLSIVLLEAMRTSRYGTSHTST